MAGLRLPQKMEVQLSPASEDSSGHCEQIFWPDQRPCIRKLTSAAFLRVEQHIMHIYIAAILEDQLMTLHALCKHPAEFGWAFWNHRVTSPDALTDRGSRLLDQPYVIPPIDIREQHPYCPNIQQSGHCRCC